MQSNMYMIQPGQITTEDERPRAAWTGPRPRETRLFLNRQESRTDNGKRDQYIAQAPPPHGRTGKKLDLSGDHRRTKAGISENDTNDRKPWALLNISENRKTPCHPYTIRTGKAPPAIPPPRHNLDSSSTTAMDHRTTSEPPRHHLPTRSARNAKRRPLTICYYIAKRPAPCTCRHHGPIVKTPP